MSINYYPILKWKKGEQEALKNLKIFSDNFYPVIEIIDECKPVDFFSALKTCCNFPIYFDLSRFEKELLDDYIAYVALNNISAYPVLYVDDIIGNTNDLPERYSVKIPIPVDFEGPTFEEILEILVSHNPFCINLILDAGEVLEQRTANTVFDSYNRIISDNISILSRFGGIIICLTSFPELLDIEAGGDAEYKRYDFLILKKLYQKYKDSELEGKLHYSDYGVTKFTETEIDFSKMRYGILPKVKYTAETKYIVKKGEKDRRNNTFTRSYIDISKEIVKSSYYYGKDFSYGDKCIYEKANIPNAKTGNSTQWVTYCANHHLTVLVEQLSSLTGS